MFTTTLVRRSAMAPGAAMMLLLPLLLSGGCVSTQPMPPEPEPATLSAVLAAELGVVVDEAIEDAAARGVLPSPIADRGAFVESVRRSMLAQYAEAMATRPDEEQRFRAGVFAATSNRQRVRKLLGQFHDDGVPLNTVESYLAGQFAADRIGGARLELAARLLKAHYDAILMGELLSAF